MAFELSATVPGHEQDFAQIGKPRFLGKPRSLRRFPRRSHPERSRFFGRSEELALSGAEGVSPAGCRARPQNSSRDPVPQLHGSRRLYMISRALPERHTL